MNFTELLTRNRDKYKTETELIQDRQIWTCSEEFPLIDR